MADFVRITEEWSIGASTDTKPALCPTGHKCYEYNTKKWYITHNTGTTWTEMQDLDAIVLGAGSALIGKVGIDQTTPGTTNRVDIGAALPAGTNNIGEVDIALTEMVRYPFAKGSLTTNGVQYSAEVASIGDTYTEVEKVTITQPTGYALDTIELGLTGAVKSSGATEAVNWKWQISDDGNTWVDLIAEQTVAASAAAYADVSCSGRFLPAAGALLTGSTFQVRMVAKSAAAAGETAAAKVKNSSYITTRYRRS